MSQNIDRLFNLLPTIYRQRDADENGQLKALLRVIAEQVNIVEADIAQLYENWFIETCQDWVVPYIGDLIGYQPVREAGEAADITGIESQQLTRALSSRREVGNTIAYRRRKGTLSLLAQLAQDVAGWPAYAIEFYRLLGVSQSSNFRHLQRGRVVDIRKHSALEQIGHPFDREAHRVDVRRVDSSMTQGRFNLPSVGLFVWRLKSYPATRVTAYCVRDGNPSCYTFSVLGNDRPLYNHPQATRRPEDELNFPGRITRRELREHLADYYGEGKSIQIWSRERLETGEGQEHQVSSQTEQRESHASQQSSRHVEHFEGHRHHGYPEHYGHYGEQYQMGAQQSSPPNGQDAQGAQPPVSGRPPHTANAQQEPQLPLVAPERIVAADLSEWAYRPHGDKVAVDPQLGRIIFPLGDQVDDVVVSFYYGFSADIGGGEYNRPTLRPSTYQLFQVGEHPGATQGFTTVQGALDAWQDWKANNPLPHYGVIEIVDNGVYTEQLNISLEQDERLEICAANRRRPVLRLIEWKEDRPDYLKVSGGPGSHFTLDGLLITGGIVQVSGHVKGVHLRHCTLVPGRGLRHDCEPRSPGEPSLELFHAGECVTIEHSILGIILVYENEKRDDPIRMTISDSILDAASMKHDALCRPEDDRIAYVDLTVLRSTILGRVRVHSIAPAENSIFTGELTVARRQAGCMRFCSINPESRTPRRFHCQPDLAREAARKEVQGIADQQAKDAYIRRAVDRVRPVFNSTRYGRPDYCQLAFACAPEITRGADDESELGVFHDLYQPQRGANLRARLAEFTPAGVDTGIIFVS